MWRRRRLSKVRAAVNQYHPVDREHGFQLLEAANVEFEDLLELPPLGSALGALVLYGFGLEPGSERWRAHSIALMLGYACRLGQPDPPFPSDLALVIDEQLSYDATGRLERERIVHDPVKLAKLILAPLSAGCQLRTLSGCTAQAWEVFTMVGTEHALLLIEREGFRPWHRPRRSRIPTLLERGYFICFVDEVAGETPAFRTMTPSD